MEYPYARYVVRPLDRPPPCLSWFDFARYLLAITCSISSLTLSATIHYTHNLDLVGWALLAGVCRHILDIFGYICSRHLPRPATNCDVKLFTMLTLLLSVLSTIFGAILVSVQHHRFALYSFVCSLASVISLSMAVMSSSLASWRARRLAAEAAELGQTAGAPGLIETNSPAREEARALADGRQADNQSEEMKHAAYLAAMQYVGTPHFGATPYAGATPRNEPAGPIASYSPQLYSPRAGEAPQLYSPRLSSAHEVFVDSYDEEWPPRRPQHPRPPRKFPRRPNVAGRPPSSKFHVEDPKQWNSGTEYSVTQSRRDSCCSSALPTDIEAQTTSTESCDESGCD
jgi:hypothetical protein